MVSLNQIVDRSRPRVGQDIRALFSRNGLENALLLAVNDRGDVLEFAADINGVSLFAFAAFAPEGTQGIEVWAWRPGLEFVEAQKYSFSRLAPRIPGVPQPKFLNPPAPPPPTAFVPRLPGINNPNGPRREPAYRS